MISMEMNVCQMPNLNITFFIAVTLGDSIGIWVKLNEYLTIDSDALKLRFN
jgi:hypothetical protein